ncbi:hypothetical protein PGTUg99_027083 [Puccinia graminis f. sp. tritici]|uniref:Uncharacterized protein n=1 Tax=Puccinia graminis f. sp. tritici TaxID=56615 RepID=A0A5B0RGT3_PUCGR|nr:hypothetical protein PGTUg99_027083 [Puccinia graminis f. sp. tritici]
MVTLTDRDAHRRALGKWLTADGWDDRPDILVDLTPSVTEHVVHGSGGMASGRRAAYANGVTADDSLPPDSQSSGGSPTTAGVEGGRLTIPTILAA